MSGPIRKPVVQKIAEGNPGKRSLKGVPQFDGVPIAPDWFGEEAKALWNKLVPDLEAKGLIAAAFGPDLEGLCASYARAVEAERILKVSGMTFTTDKGYVGQHPAVAIAANSWSQVEKFSARFGLSPADVGKVAVAPKGEESLRDLLTRDVSEWDSSQEKPN